MAPGCPDRLTWEFVRWVWTYPARRRRGILHRLAGLRPDQRAIVVSSTRSVRRFLEGLPTPPTADPFDHVAKRILSEH